MHARTALAVIVISTSVAGAAVGSAAAQSRGRGGGDPGPIETIATGRGSTIAFIHLAPRRPSADAVILLSGGGGVLALQSGRPRLGNFVVRTRGRYARAGYRVIVPDVPTDRSGGVAGARTQAWYGADIARLAAWARAQGAGRVWVVSTSRGTIGAVNVATVPGARIDGIVLTSSLMRPSRRYAGTVFDLPLARIRVPVLIVHHAEDGCAQTPPSVVPRLAAALTSARPVTVRMMTGGQAFHPRRGRNSRLPECGPWSHHGFLGIEGETVGVITGWMAQNRH